MNSSQIFLLQFIVVLISVKWTSAECEELEKPANGYFVGGICSSALESICVVGCLSGYRTVGSAIRTCKQGSSENRTMKWTGQKASCEIVKCPTIEIEHANMISNCSNSTHFGTTCSFECQRGFRNIGSATRRCLPLGIWSGIKAKCLVANDPLHDSAIDIDDDRRPSKSNDTRLSSEPIYFRDLSSEMLTFGFSFKKISLVLDVFKAPLSFSMWIRINYYTKSIRILSFKFKAASFFIASNAESKFDFFFLLDFIFDISKI